MYPRIISYLSSGRLQKQCTTGSTPLPVMSGALGACFMRSGLSDMIHMNI